MKPPRRWNGALFTPDPAGKMPADDAPASGFEIAAKLHSLM
jgi:hypothetical protein